MCASSFRMGIKFPNLCPNQRLHTSKSLDQQRYMQSTNARAGGRKKKALLPKLILTPVFLLHPHLSTEIVCVCVCARVCTRARVCVCAVMDSHERVNLRARTDGWCADAGWWWQRGEVKDWRLGVVQLSPLRR